MKFFKWIFISTMMVSPLLAAKAYELGVHQVPGYSKPILLVTSGVIPLASITKIHLHLHGWTQEPATGKPFQSKFDFEWKNGDVNPAEKDLRKFVEAYSIQKEVETNPDRAVLIPIARGHCDQYPELVSSFDSVASAIFEAVGIKNEQMVFDYASAHSGGGEVLSKLLLNTVYLKRVKKVLMLDAIYHQATRERLAVWLKEPLETENKSLEMAVISQQTPQQLGKLLLQNFKGETLKVQFQWADSLFAGVEKKMASGNTVSMIEEQKPFVLDHWTIAKAFLEMSLSPDVKRKPSSKKNLR